ncbi:hypothetical protein Bbelb_055060 [Branchiostoma belcheri]|nr:hypothetical protein Bbelb_055060 [Branchiostoma belcheri]
MSYVITVAIIVIMITLEDGNVDARSNLFWQAMRECVGSLANDTIFRRRVQCGSFKATAVLKVSLRIRHSSTVLPATLVRNGSSWKQRSCTIMWEEDVNCGFGIAGCDVGTQPCL